MNLSRSQWDELIDQWVIGYRNCQRDRDILRRHLFDGVCFEPLAEEFDLSVRQVKNIVRKAKHRVFTHIK